MTDWRAVVAEGASAFFFLSFSPVSFVGRRGRTGHGDVEIEVRRAPARLHGGRPRPVHERVDEVAHAGRRRGPQLVDGGQVLEVGGALRVPQLLGAGQVADHFRDGELRRLVEEGAVVAVAHEGEDGESGGWC